MSGRTYGELDGDEAGSDDDGGGGGGSDDDGGGGGGSDDDGGGGGGSDDDGGGGGGSDDDGGGGGGGADDDGGGGGGGGADDDGGGGPEDAGGDEKGGAGDEKGGAVDLKGGAVDVKGGVEDDKSAGDAKGGARKDGTGERTGGDDASTVAAHPDTSGLMVDAPARSVNSMGVSASTQRCGSDGCEWSRDEVPDVDAPLGPACPRLASELGHTVCQATTNTTIATAMLPTAVAASWRSTRPHPPGNSSRARLPGCDM